MNRKRSAGLSSKNFYHDTIAHITHWRKEKGRRFIATDKILTIAICCHLSLSLSFSLSFSYSLSAKSILMKMCCFVVLAQRFPHVWWCFILSSVIYVIWAHNWKTRTHCVCERNSLVTWLPIYFGRTNFSTINQPAYNFIIKSFYFLVIFSFGSVQKKEEEKETMKW